MIAQNINTKKTRGFTIVELLVVIVVIGILAAITIVSYTGITQKANTTKAQTNAQSAQSVAEVYAAELNHYPRVSADFVASTTTKLPAGICMVTTAGTGQGCTAAQTALSSTNGTTAIQYEYCGAIAAPAAGAELGGRFRYYDFSTSAISTTITYVGSGSATLGGNCNTWVGMAS